MPFEAGSVIAKFKADTSDFKNGIKTAKNELGGFKTSLGGVGGLATKVGAALGLALGARELINGLKASVNASIELENALTGLNSVANALGVNATQAKDAAQDLARDGLMSVKDAAEGLKNLLSTGFSLPEAINLMNSFKDAAAFNRQGTLEFGQAIVGATQGLKNQNSIMVDNVGITKNLSVIMDEAGLSVDALGQVTSNTAVRQKLYNGLMKEASIFQGDAARAAETTGGKMATLKTTIFNLKAAVGDALAPAVMMVADALNSSLTPAIQWLKDNSVTLKAYIMGLTGAFLILGQVAVSVARVLVAMFRGDFAGAVNAVGDGIEKVKERFVKTQEKIVDMAKKSYGGMEVAAGKSFDRQSQAHNKKTQKMMKDLEDETRKFDQEMKKREKRYKEQLADLINAHLDKKKRLEEDIDEENADFTERMAERTTDFADKMQDMKDTHAEKVADIQAQIDEETAKGAEADATRLASLQESLAKENAEYEKKSLKAQQDYEKETKKLQDEHDKRLKDYEEELAEEKRILDKHKSDVKKVKDQERVDDITRLKQQYEEENEAAAEEHARRLEEIRERGSELGDTLGGAIDSAIGAHQDDIEATLKEMGEQGGAQLESSLGAAGTSAGKSLMNKLMSGIMDTAKSAAKWLEGKGITGKGSSTVFSVILDIAKWKLPSFDTGGIVPGSIGSPQMVMAHGGETILPTHKAGNVGFGGANINVDLRGSIISGDLDAMRLGEKVGDSIVNKLKQNIRF